MRLHVTNINYIAITLFSAYMLVEADVPRTNQ
jgi:hypothetical protein